jgi:prophage tail gpP-like protein
VSNDVLFEAVLGNGKTLKSGPNGSVKSWNIDQDYTSPTDPFSFTFFAPKEADRYGLQMMPLDLYVNGQKQLTGRIGNVKKGSNGRMVTVSGNDYIHDFVAGQVDPTVLVQAGDKLDAMVLTVLKPYGVTEITTPEKLLAERTGVKPSRSIPKLVSADLQQAKPTQAAGAYQFIKQIVTRHAYIIQPGIDRTKVSLETPNYLQAPIYDFIRTDTNDGTGNVIESESTSDTTSFPTYAKFVGQSGKSDEKRSTNQREFDIYTRVVDLAPELAESIKKWCAQGRRKPKDAGALSNGQLYRLMYFEDKLAKSGAQIGAALMRAVYDQLKKSLSYECTVKGVTDPRTKAIYTVNTMANINDSIADVHEMLWAYSCSKSGDEGGGVKTTMKFYRPGSYQIDAEGHGG